jgi:hypothetical protein
MERASGCISWIARILAYLFAGLLVLSLPLSILANNTLRTILSPDDIGNSVAELLLVSQDLSGQLLGNFVSDSIAGPDSSFNSRTLANLSLEDRAEVTQILFPEDWLKTQIRLNIGSIIAWIDSEEPFPRLNLDLEPLWSQLRQGGSFRIAEIWVDALPLCTSEQETRLAESWQQGDPIGVNLCRPAGGELHQQLIDRANQQLIQMLDKVPVEISLLDEMGSNEVTKELSEFRRNILGFLLVMRWMRILPFLFLGLIMTTTIRSWSDMRNWWGIPIGLGALMTFLVVLIGNGIGPGILKNTLSQSAQPAELQESFVNTIWGLISSIMDRSAFHALILLIIVIFAFIIPILLRKKGTDSNPTPSSIDVPRSSANELPPPPQVEPFQPETITDAPANDRSEGNDE